ncbi:hypothetical protein [Gordonia pseudamarae]|uniref:hypothetical protein n=1 Tax=Gordonia pseudamarae TaxID=2831662 RepID=UPI003899478D
MRRDLPLRWLRCEERSTGYPDADTCGSVTVEVPEPGAGQLVVKVDRISLDPAMRRRLNDVRSYIPPVGIGEAMRAAGTDRALAGSGRRRRQLQASIRSSVVTTVLRIDRVFLRTAWP